MRNSISAAVALSLATSPALAQETQTQDTEETATAENESHFLPIHVQHCTAQEQMASHTTTFKIDIQDVNEDVSEVSEEQAQQIIGMIGIYFKQLMEQVAITTYKYGNALSTKNVQNILDAFVIASGIEEALEKQTGLDIENFSINYVRTIADNQACLLEDQPTNKYTDFNVA